MYSQITLPPFQYPSDEARAGGFIQDSRWPDIHEELEVSRVNLISDESESAEGRM